MLTQFEFSCSMKILSSCLIVTFSTLYQTYKNRIAYPIVQIFFSSLPKKIATGSGLACPMGNRNHLLLRAWTLQLGKPEDRRKKKKKVKDIRIIRLATLTLRSEHAPKNHHLETIFVADHLPSLIENS